MYNYPQIENTVSKIKRFAQMLDELIYEKVGDLGNLQKYITNDHLYDIPEKTLFSPVVKGELWEGERTNCWIKGSFVVPKELQGRKLYIYPHIEAYEGLLWVNGKPFGNFANKLLIGSHGNQYCKMIEKNATSGQNIDIAIEFYAGHYDPGCFPFEVHKKSDYKIALNDIDICVENELVYDTLINLRIVLDLYDNLPKTNFRHADITAKLLDIHKIIYYDYKLVSKEEFEKSLEAINGILQDLLNKKNGDTTAFVGLIGHSHMDTAWLWEIPETIRKCARTYSNQMNIMQQYPKYKFIQSSSYHTDMMKKHYPELFLDIKEKVKEGRYEPNGGTWVECDCNIVSGESMVRQFLWGQRFTKENFNYKSNVFWLPDTFGYNACIPQILKKCDIDYFLTTKMAWNDTNVFPYDTFKWKGIDGTTVVSHLNKTHEAPSPKTLLTLTETDGRDSIKLRHASNKKLLSYGPGDGGGGPDDYMVRMAEKLEDVEGCPRTKYTSVGDFMKNLEKTSKDLPIYSGELYLELHRGTLTNQHQIKRNNRIGEIALHDLEAVTILDAIKNNKEIENDKTNELYGTLLVNQFHDILPGTSLESVHTESKKQMANMIDKAKDYTKDIIINKNESNEKVTLINTLSFERNDVVYLDIPEGYRVKGNYKQQWTRDIDDNKILAVMGVVIPPVSTIVLEIEKGDIETEFEFDFKDKALETEKFKVKFEDNMTISSYYDKEAKRELVGEEYSLNTLLMAEDVPEQWDNWDINWDLYMKYENCSNLLNSEIISNGDVELRIRNDYKISDKSTLKQDMIFYKDSKQIVFDTKLDWNEEHRFLKTMFDTTIFSDFSRQEIQFGNIKRSTHKNTSIEQAKFEVCNHKYTDLSEGNYGVSILNDCKYGISVDESKIGLSLHKAGMRPDLSGDKGVHYFKYSFLPHMSGFDAKNVVQKAYEFNYNVNSYKCDNEYKSLLSVSQDNIIVETIKPCEDDKKCFVLRVYECCGNFTHTDINLNLDNVKLYETNMLEENPKLISETNTVNITFKPFKIKTILVEKK